MMNNDYSFTVPLCHYEKAKTILKSMNVDDYWNKAVRISAVDPLFGHIIFGAVTFYIECSKRKYKAIFKRVCHLCLTKALPEPDKTGLVKCYTSSQTKLPL